MEKLKGVRIQTGFMLFKGDQENSGDNTKKFLHNSQSLGFLQKVKDSQSKLDNFNQGLQPKKKHKHKAINKETHKLINQVMQKSIPLNRKKNFIAIASRDVSISNENSMKKVQSLDKFNNLQKAYRSEIREG